MLHRHPPEVDPVTDITITTDGLALLWAGTIVVSVTYTVASAIRWLTEWLDSRGQIRQARPRRFWE
jgi:hypothetical protein